MPAQDKLPARPGFTRSMPFWSAPVVVGVTGSRTSITALRRAADEAAQRSAPLHVIAGGPVEETLGPASADEREWHTISWILRRPQVTVSIVDASTPEALVSYCRQVTAGLLVIGCERESPHDELESPVTAHRLVETAECDVLVVHSRQQVALRSWT